MRGRRGLNVLIAIVLLTVIHWVDARTGSAPFQHLYYIPIVFGAIAVPPYGGALAAVMAVVLYHVGNPRLLTFMYAEADIVQIALFLAIGIVTARLADDARRLRHMSETDDLTGLFNLRGFERRLADAMASARRQDGPLAMLVLDVDRLKSLNDTHGHHTGPPPCVSSAPSSGSVCQTAPLPAGLAATSSSSRCQVQMPKRRVMSRPPSGKR